MSPIVAFFLGLLIGLLVEWIIDWLYWRKRQAALQAELDRTKASMATAGPANAGLEGQLAAVADYDSLQQKYAGLAADQAALKRQLSTLTTEKATLTEQLQACQGKLSAAESHPSVEAPVSLVKSGAAEAPVSLVKHGVAESKPAVDAPVTLVKPAGPTVKDTETPTVRMPPAAAVVPDDLEIIKGRLVR